MLECPYILRQMYIKVNLSRADFAEYRRIFGAGIPGGIHSKIGMNVKPDEKDTPTFDAKVIYKVAQLIAFFDESFCAWANRQNDAKMGSQSVIYGEMRENGQLW